MLDLRLLVALIFLFFWVVLGEEIDLEKSTINDSERLAANLEFEKFEHSISMARKHNIELHGFYHVSDVHQYWENIVSEQLMLLDGFRKFPLGENMKITNHPNATAKGNPKIDYHEFHWDYKTKYASLLQHSTSLTINFAIPYLEDRFDTNRYEVFKNYVDSLRLDGANKIKFTSFMSLERGTNIKIQNASIGEFTTINNLREFCVTKRKEAPEKRHLVYYFHNKGSCCHKGTNYDEKYIEPRAMWREYMNAANLEFPSICLRAIGARSYSTCGTQLQENHYSGNFWWADCDHVSKLPPLVNPLNWMGPEFFLFSLSPNNTLINTYTNNCAYSFYHFPINLYDSEVSRDMYRERLFSFLKTKIPTSLGLKTTNDKPPGSLGTDKCKEIRLKKSNFSEMQKELKEILN